MAEVQVIPPKAARPDTLRVAAYCRVSSDSADQLHSYAAQIRAYTQAINAHDGWDLVDIYADEGLTGMRQTAGRARSIRSWSSPSPDLPEIPATVSPPCGNFPRWV